jgi:hypothetical protein
VDGDDPVKQRDDDENQKTERKVIQKRIKIDLLPLKKDSAGDDDSAQHHRRDHPFGKPPKRLAHAAKRISEHSITFHQIERAVSGKLEVPSNRGKSSLTARLPKWPDLGARSESFRYVGESRLLSLADFYATDAEKTAF